MVRVKKEEADSSEHQAFYDCLRKKNLKRTAQRDVILNVFLHTKGHVSSEELYHRVKQVDPSIGFTTVYRTLKLLTDCGLAHQVQVGDGYTRYEQGFHYSHHDHLICVRCGELTEFYNQRLEAIQDQIVRRHHFKMLDHSLRIWGVCQKCQTATSE
jgi:Fur family ferric uptake transcriptional regulator